MSVSSDAAQHLPYLRRYARALTGSQDSGDAYVSVVLETLIEVPQHLEGEDDPRVALYGIFTRIWDAMAIDAGADPTIKKLPADRRLTHLAPRPRQAFLLTALEGFSESEVARILNVDVSKVRDLIETAGRELANDIATDVLIIEDELFIATDIENLVEKLGHSVVGIARSHAEAVRLANIKRPGLILADIRLADESSGLDAVNEILQRFEVPVIFITAYPERFLTGTRPEPAYLIPKPYQPAMVSAVVSQALFFERNARLQTQRAS